MNFNFELTEQEANAILNALASQPYSQVAQLIQKIMQQAAEQTRNGNENNQTN